jgi:O-antigen ligase
MPPKYSGVPSAIRHNRTVALDSRTVFALTMFVVGASIVIDIPLVGRLMGPDLLCTVGLSLALLSRRYHSFGRDAQWFFLMFGLWFASAIITDIVRQTEFADFVRGWAKIVFFAITFAFSYLASRTTLSPIVYFYVGLQFGSLAQQIVSPSAFFVDEPWKFGYGPPVTILVLTLISTRAFVDRFKVVGQLACLAAIAIANLAGNTRSVFGILVVTAGLVWAGLKHGRFRWQRPLPKWAFIALLACGIVLSQGVVSAYELAASSGLLGQAALEKYESQSQGSLSILQSGRTESLVSIQAIQDSPFIGHGSWARDFYYIGLYVRALEDSGLRVAGDAYEDDLIPTHSFLLGAWVESGILGGLFWMFCIVVAFRALYASFHIPPENRPLVVFVVVNFFWCVLFSPFGAQERFFVAVELCMMLWAIRRSGAALSPQAGGALT